MSHFLYMHKATCGTSNVTKVGKVMTPYSAVRLRQRNMAKQFFLDHVYFGNPRHISFLESKVKQELDHKKLTGKAQTELFNISVSDMNNLVNNIIKEHDLQVSEVVLAEPYSATNSGDCPLGVPSEQNCFGWLEDERLRQFGQDPNDHLFSCLFEEVDNA